MSENKEPYVVVPDGYEWNKDVMTQAEHEVFVKSQQKKKHKYNAKAQDEDGFHFDSKAELRRYRDLRLMYGFKKIDDFEVHPVFVLIDDFVYQGKKIRGIRYEADFRYTENGVTVIEEVKGVRTKEFNLKLKLFMVRYPEYDFRLIT